MSKMKKFLKIILIIILVVLILLVIYVARNFIIVKKLQKNISPYKISTNFHVKVSQKGGSSDYTMDYYKKDEKQMLIHKAETVTMTIYDDGKTRTTYIESPTEKYYIPNSQSDVLVSIDNTLETENNWQTLLASITAKIKKTDYNGKQCYMIKDFMSSSYMSQGEDEAEYIEADTGLLAKTVMGDVEFEKEYEFDCVTDENFVEPDTSEYELRTE